MTGQDAVWRHIPAENEALQRFHTLCIRQRAKYDQEDAAKRVVRRVQDVQDETDA